MVPEGQWLRDYMHMYKMNCGKTKHICIYAVVFTIGMLLHFQI